MHKQYWTFIEREGDVRTYQHVEDTWCFLLVREVHSEYRWYVYEENGRITTMLTTPRWKKLKTVFTEANDIVQKWRVLL